MTAVNVKFAIGVPSLTTSGTTNTSLSGTGIGLAFVVQSKTTDAITHIRLRYGARTGTPPTYAVTIEGVDANGKPDGTDKGGGSPTAKTFTPPADATWNSLVQEFALTNSYTPASKDEWLAITIRHSSGTCDASNFSSFSRNWNNWTASTIHVPVCHTLSAGVWTNTGASGPIAWRTASATFGFIAQDEYQTATANTAGHKSGAYFTLPSAMGSTFKIRQVTSVIKLGAAAGSCKFAIWDTGDTELQSIVIDSDLAISPSTTKQTSLFFNTPATLQYGTKYRIGVEAISGSVCMYGMSFAAAADKSAVPYGDVIGHARWNGMTWTEDATILPLIEFGVDDITVPSGGGAGSIVIGNSGSVIRGLI